MPNHRDLRYEFRIFSDDLSDLNRLLFERLQPTEHEASRQIYIVSRLTIDANLKIRHETLDLKTLVAREGLFELWQPTFSAALPVDTADFMAEVAPHLGVSVERPRRGHLTEDDILGVCADTPALGAIMLRKKRTKFQSGGATAEFTELTLGETRVHSVAVESEDLEAANGLTADLGLQEYANESYPAFLQHLVFG